MDKEWGQVVQMNLGEVPDKGHGMETVRIGELLDAPRACLVSFHVNYSFYL